MEFRNESVFLCHIITPSVIFIVYLENVLLGGAQFVRIKVLYSYQDEWRCLAFTEKQIFLLTYDCFFEREFFEHLNIKYLKLCSFGLIHVRVDREFENRHH
jgi:hypothetical protein